MGAKSPEGNAQVWVLDLPTEIQKVWGWISRGKCATLGEAQQCGLLSNFLDHLSTKMQQRTLNTENVFP